jgi:hypothetical protein
MASMDNLLVFLGAALRPLVFSFLFFWPGLILVRLATSGRYPRTIDPRKRDCADYEIVSVIGLLTVVGLIIFLTYLLR